MKNTNYFFVIVAVGCMFFSSCKDDDDDAPLHMNTLIYKVDGRGLKLSDSLPLTLDISGDGEMDFTIFMELTANNMGDRLYAGINPIGANLVKSGPAINENFLNMGLLVAETVGANIDFEIANDERWTADHGALVIRNTLVNGTIFYEGNWAASQQIVGIQNKRSGQVYFGWVRLAFDKNTEFLTIVDYAYETATNTPIKAGAKNS